MISETPEKSDLESSEGLQSKEGFLSRWSRRKQQDEDRVDDAAVIDTSSDHQPSLDNAAAEIPLPQDTDEPEEELLTDADMPAIETITSNSDMSMFFNRGVSRELRKAALKHLFGLPALNITDGLNDYDEDYTSFEPLGDIVTSDMKFHAERKARLAEEEEARQLAEAESQTLADENRTDENPADQTQTDQTQAEDEPAAEEVAQASSDDEDHSTDSDVLAEESDAMTADAQGVLNKHDPNQQHEPVADLADGDASGSHDRKNT